MNEELNTKTNERMDAEDEAEQKKPLHPSPLYFLFFLLMALLLWKWKSLKRGSFVLAEAFSLE